MKHYKKYASETRSGRRGIREGADALDTAYECARELEDEVSFLAKTLGNAVEDGMIRSMGSLRDMRVVAGKDLPRILKKLQGCMDGLDSWVG